MTTDRPVARFDERVVRVAAALLPHSIRETRREEWLADLEGAQELGIPRSSIVLAALRYAIVEVSVRERFTGARTGSWIITGAIAVLIVVVGVPGAAVAAFVINHNRGVVTVEQAPDGSETTVEWRNYPSVAGLDPDEVLAGPSLGDALETSPVLLAEIRDALTAEFGLAWASDPFVSEAEAFPSENQYGGQSLLSGINSPTSPSVGVPREWADKQKALDIIGEVAARYGFAAPRLDQDAWGTSEEDRIRDLGGATPEEQVFVSAMLLGPAGQWISVNIQDFSKDVDGRLAERATGDAENGWQTDTIAIMYGANGLLAESDRDAFVERLQEFDGYQAPEGRMS